MASAAKIASTSITSVGLPSPLDKPSYLQLDISSQMPFLAIALRVWGPLWGLLKDWGEKTSVSSYIAKCRRRHPLRHAS